MEELKNFSSEQLIQRAKEYQKRLESLMDNISAYLANKNVSTELIQNEYADLKEKIGEEYRYFSASKNNIIDLSQIHNCYQSAIMEASAKGFGVRKNSGISQSMFSAVDDAIYPINYYMGEYIK